MDPRHPKAPAGKNPRRLTSLHALFLTFLLWPGGFLPVTAQDTTDIREGWSLGLLPSVMFDSDIGFQYGAIINLVRFDEEIHYPDFRYLLYAEWSRQTKGGAINQLLFDAPHLLNNGWRFTIDLSLLTEKALGFYGFNGQEAYWDEALEDPDRGAYISRMYYRHQRRMLRLSGDLQGRLRGDLRWVAGLAYLDIGMSSVDLDDLNKGLTGGDVLPDTALLYDRYVEWGVIPAEEAEGGRHALVKAGLVLDRRDIEANPSRGCWSEAVLWYVAGEGSAFLRYNVIHRQYFTLRKDRLTLAGRAGLQGTLAGSPAWYTLPLMLSSFDKSTTKDGLGGAKTIRGIRRNRVVGDGMAYANLELRYKVLRTRLGRQDFYIALNGFTDAGMVVTPYKFDRAAVPPEECWPDEKDIPHLASGLGAHFALNENFIIAVDYGRAWKQQDGKDGLYINLGWLF